MPATYEPIATTTLVSTSTLITFSSIPATYTDLFVACQIKRTSANLFLRVTVNNDTSSLYSYTRVAGYDTSGVAGDRQTNQANWQPYINTGSFINFASLNANFMNYANTTSFKSVLFSNAEALRTTSFTSERTLTSGLYRSTSAINRIDFTAGGNSFAIGSSFTVYGIKAA